MELLGLPSKGSVVASSNWGYLGILRMGFESVRRVVLTFLYTVHGN